MLKKIKKYSDMETECKNYNGWVMIETSINEADYYEKMFFSR